MILPANLTNGKKHVTNPTIIISNHFQIYTPACILFVARSTNDDNAKLSCTRESLDRLTII